MPRPKPKERDKRRSHRARTRVAQPPSGVIIDASNPPAAVIPLYSLSATVSRAARAARVAKIAAAVREGRYVPDASVIADRMIGRSIARLAPTQVP